MLDIYTHIKLFIKMLLPIYKPCFYMLRKPADFVRFHILVPLKHVANDCETTNYGHTQSKVM